jgi:hypothetical protein
MTEPRKHPKLVGLLYYLGFLSLFCSLGTFGSAQFLNYRASIWTAATARIQGCSLEKYETSEPKLYALACDITYPIAGQVLSNSFLTNLTRSPLDRLAISDWVSQNPSGATLALRVNPSSPRQFIVQGHLPVTRGDDPADFLYAAAILGAVSLVLLAIARALRERVS